MPGRTDKDGDHHLNLLDAAWEKAQERWDDDMSRHFDARYWMPLLNESRAYLSALHNLLELLAAAERDTEY
jgi:hypothetical protein